MIGVWLFALMYTVTTVYKDGAAASATPEGNVKTIIGSGSNEYADGVQGKAKFDHPSAIAIGPDRTFYIMEIDGGRLRKVW